MITKIYTIYDSKAEAYLPPIYQPSTGAMLRMLEDTVADEQHQFNKHAEDFSLFEIGSFDDSTAKFNLHDAPQHIANAIEYKK